MMVSLCARTIDAAVPLAEVKNGSEIGYAACEYNQGVSARFSPADVSIAYEIGTEHPLVIDGAMHTVTAGIDMATSIKLAAGTILEVWYR